MVDLINLGSYDILIKLGDTKNIYRVRYLGYLIMHFKHSFDKGAVSVSDTHRFVSWFAEYIPATCGLVLSFSPLKIRQEQGHFV
jgi:hypothetical protein